MCITVQLPAPLRDYCDGASELHVSASTVRAVLEQLEQSHGSVYRSICDETGAVRRHIHLFVNSSLVRGRLDVELAAGDVLTIMPAVSGG